MNHRARRLAIALVAAALAACGGGGGDGSGAPGAVADDPGAVQPGTSTPSPAPEAPATPTRTLSGQFVPDAKGAIVCLDSNRNLACDPAEPAATVDASGGYTLRVPEDARLERAILVAELPADSAYGAPAHTGTAPVTPFTVASPASAQFPPAGTAATATPKAPADATGVAAPFGVASTLAALRMQDDETLDGATALLLAQAGLGLGSSADAGSVAQLEAIALPALRSAAGAAYAAMPADDASTAQATQQAAPELATVLAQYMNPATGTLQPFVGEKTLASEAAAKVAPRSCSIEDLPVMRITVENNDPIFNPALSGNGKEPYRNAMITFDDGPNAGIEIATEIKGRGNTTWNHTDYLKKPYRLKLAKPGMSLMGMPAARNWALLANYSDKTGLRNAVAFCLGRQMNLRYANRSQFVELFLNGNYQGVYQLTEHKEVAPDRVEIGEAPPKDTFDPEAGWLAEMDDRVRIKASDPGRASQPDEDPWFRSNGSKDTGHPGRWYAVQSDTVSDWEGYQQGTGSYTDPLGRIVDGIKAEVEAMEAAFNDPDPGQRMAKAAPLVDMEELADFYLINEFMRNSDAFWSSTYVYRPRGGKITFGPLWDFDLSSGNDDGVSNGTNNWCPQGWFVRWASSDYIEPLLGDPAFQKLIEARWQFLSSRLPAVFDFIDQASGTMAQAQARNFAVWDVTRHVWPNWIVMGSYQGEVEYLKAWLEARRDWMNARIASLDNTTDCSGWISQWQGRGALESGWQPAGAL